MITKYINSVKVKFNPFHNSGKASRLFLARMPQLVKIDCKVLPNTSTEKPSIEVIFKDKHVIKANPETMKLNDLKELFNKHSRKLAIEDAIKE